MTEVGVCDAYNELFLMIATYDWWIPTNEKQQFEKKTWSSASIAE